MFYLLSLSSLKASTNHIDERQMKRLRGVIESEKDKHFFNMRQSYYSAWIHQLGSMLYPNDLRICRKQAITLYNTQLKHMIIYLHRMTNNVRSCGSWEMEIILFLLSQLFRTIQLNQDVILQDDLLICEFVGNRRLKKTIKLFCNVLHFTSSHACTVCTVNSLNRLGAGLIKGSWPSVCPIGHYNMMLF